MLDLQHLQTTPFTGSTGDVPALLAVQRREEIADGVVRLDLVRPDGRALPEWSPGTHLSLDLANGLQRQYSLCGARDDSAWSIAVQREQPSRGGSAWLHDHATPGTELPITHVRNNFDFDPASNYVFVAGGIGITPLVSMVEAAESSGARWRMLYGGRGRASMAFLQQLSVYEQVTVCAEDEHGRPDLAGYIGEPRNDTLIYACGPAGMLNALYDAAAAWPAGSLRVERFTAADLDQDNGTFVVELARAKKEVVVGSDQSILDSVRAAGIDAMSSCEEGTCGTCETRVLSGIPEHRDVVLSDADRASNCYMMICVSRSQGERLVLDL
ncbi:oxidoreductase [Nocardioides glacieisoli]|uniref:Oxidoreductase n=1 Tax=Nocardioides glacieisoli TaxID=1168730 RepID=A0A4Q2RWD6_9ACTN|nr:PDR/VanB family oxidoreductase [Nocardioides glacieisoli]RYB92265.1 oxidoreductase [Nocardioides glacieisoli]